MPSGGIGPDGNGAIVVRSGAMGACVGRRKPRLGQSDGDELSEETEVNIEWVPAYWTQEEKEEVRDVTGGKSNLMTLIVVWRAES